MWHVLKEKHHDEAVGEVEVPYIRRDDGFTMREIGGGHKNEIFQCNGDFGQFAFYAARRDEFEDFDVYLVATKSTPDFKGLNLNPETNEALILAHAKDIESALFHFPPGRQFDYKPVKKVLFQMEPLFINGRINMASKLVRADDVNDVWKAGEPIKLKSLVDKRREKLPKKDGFYPVGREGYFYVEGDRVALVGTDKLVGGQLIYTTGIEWLPPHENEPMTKAKSADIVAKLEQYMIENGIHYELK
jgi:hypothetical protein